MGYLPEERGLYKKLKGREQLLYFGEQKGLPRPTAADRADHWLARFNAADWARQNTPPKVLSLLESTTPLTTLTLTEEGATDDSSIAYMAVGWVMAFLIYIAVLLYGQYVMQGVIEEKNSRVVEIIVSSVRPFELLMDKVLGIGAIGMTQLAVWGVLVLGGTSMLGSAAALFLSPSMLNRPQGASDKAIQQAVNVSLPRLPPSLFIWFVLFFLGGYLLYASLFAAVGSAVEQQQDAQSFVVPLTLIIPIVLLFFLLETPNAPFSVVMSLTSPPAPAC